MSLEKTEVIFETRLKDCKDADLINAYNDFKGELFKFISRLTASMELLEKMNYDLRKEIDGNNVKTKH